MRSVTGVATHIVLKHTEETCAAQALEQPIPEGAAQSLKVFAQILLTGHGSVFY